MNFKQKSEYDKKKDKGNRCFFNVVNDRHYIPVAYILYDNLDNGYSECHKSAVAPGLSADIGKAVGKNNNRQQPELLLGVR